MHVISLVLLALTGLSALSSLGCLCGRRISPDILPMHNLLDFLCDLQLVVDYDLVHCDECVPEPEVVRQLDVLERVLTRKLEVVARTSPVCIKYYEAQDQGEADVLLGVSELVVDKDHGE